MGVPITAMSLRTILYIGLAVVALVQIVALVGRCGGSVLGFRPPCAAPLP